MGDSAAILVDHLVVRYGRRAAPAVDDVSLEVEPGSTLAVIGESGSGKSTLIRAICGLTDTSLGRVVVAGRDLTAVPFRQRARAAGRAGIGIVFQNPLSALDPRWPIGRSIAEALPRTENAEARSVEELLDAVHLPTSTLERRPRELSGGQLQRVTIARALAAQPKVLLYDEVVSALDVSVRNEVLKLLAEVRERFGHTSIFISHDMASVVQLATHIAVMYHGQLVERGDASEVILRPREEYTQRLLDAVPTVSRTGS
jgi:ABC-type glutathione transport system ATPase component